MSYGAPSLLRTCNHQVQLLYLALTLAHPPLSYSDERQQPLTHGHPRCPVYAQWLQQRPSHLIHRLAVHTAPAPGLRGAAAQQTQTVPHHPAAVWQRHLTRDRGARTHTGAGTGGESTSYQAPMFPTTASATGSVRMATTPIMFSPALKPEPPSPLQGVGGASRSDSAREPLDGAVSLQNSTLTIEEFHSKLQEATNFPLRPFVIPFLKVNKGCTHQATGMVYAKTLGREGMRLSGWLESSEGNSCACRGWRTGDGQVGMWLDGGWGATRCCSPPQAEPSE